MEKIKLKHVTTTSSFQNTQQFTHQLAFKWAPCPSVRIRPTTHSTRYLFTIQTVLFVKICDSYSQKS
jgi:hypothetical protein